MIKRLVRERLARFVDSRLVTHDGKWEILDKVMRAQRAWRLPEGDYLEFGTYEGMSFAHACALARREGLDGMRFFAFDSFEGLPGTSSFEEAETGYDHFHPGQFACSETRFKEILAARGVDLSRVTTVPGYYEASLTPGLRGELGIRRASVVWIDVDLYRSTVPVLDWVTPLLGPGTFLLFDDWFSFGGDPRAGELRATMEWLERTPAIELVRYDRFHTAGMAFLVQPRGAGGSEAGRRAEAQTEP